MPSFTYRNDIQGLRAIAVLLVIFSHAKWPLFSGGFIGVDVFFVISGYVITQLLLKEFANTNSINFLKFYTRRLQRLLPALLVAIIGSLTAMSLLLPPETHSDQYSSALSALLWLSNFYFLFREDGYFNELSGDNIFLHTWSLGVEEQFYLLWPIFILIGLSSIGKRHAYLKLKTIFILIFLTSLLLSLVLSYTQPSYAFYMMPSRAWQFSLGGLIAVMHIEGIFQNSIKDKAILISVGNIIGLGLILFSAFLFDKHSKYPGFHALVPTIGAGFILFFFSQSKTGPITYFLSSQPLRWIGDISYSLYLWHWPILVISALINPYYSWLTSEIAIILTMVVGTIVYYSIENPIRQCKFISQKTILTLTVLTCIILTSSTLLLNNLSKSSIELINAQTDNIKAAKLPIIYELECDDWYKSTEIKPCVFGDINSSKTVVLIGDSILMQWFPVIKEYYISKNWKLIALTKSACPMVNESFYYHHIQNIYEACDKWRKSAINYINKITPNKVIMGNSPYYEFNKEQWIRGTQDILEELLQTVNNVKIILGTPKLKLNGRLCVRNNEWFAKNFPKVPMQSCDTPLQQNSSLKWIVELASQYPEVQTIDMTENICPNQICKAKIEDTIVFRDKTHLSVEFVLSQLENISPYLE